MVAGVRENRPAFIGPHGDSFLAGRDTPQRISRVDEHHRPKAIDGIGVYSLNNSLGDFGLGVKVGRTRA
jgi:hypothetical protein